MPDTSEKRHVIPPHVEAARMQRYSIYLMIGSFALVGANYASLTMASVLWFAAGICAGFALLCAITVVILHAIAWNFDRLREEQAGLRTSQDFRDPSATPGP